MLHERPFGLADGRPTRVSSAAGDQIVVENSPLGPCYGRNITRRQLWILAILGAFSGQAGKALYAREFLSPAPPITVDAALIRVDASDVRADQ
jgi:hypothetical protein